MLNVSDCVKTAVSLHLIDFSQPPAEETGGEGEGEGEGGEEEFYEIPKTPQPKEWVCLGSDLEILDSQVHTTRPLVSQ